MQLRSHEVQQLNGVEGGGGLREVGVKEGREEGGGVKDVFVTIEGS